MNLKTKITKSFINESLYETLNQTKLAISTYNSTTFLELITINKPCLLYWDSNHWPLNHHSKTYFNKLKKAGIFHTNINTLIKKIKQISPTLTIGGIAKNQAILKFYRDKFC